jgi:hypothetical protein
MVQWILLLIAQMTDPMVERIVVVGMMMMMMNEGKEKGRKMHYFSTRQPFMMTMLTKHLNCMDFQAPLLPLLLLLPRLLHHQMSSLKATFTTNFRKVFTTCTSSAGSGDTKSYKLQSHTSLQSLPEATTQIAFMVSVLVQVQAQAAQR